ncbi:MAG: CCA tRNA nucleotidyltransferase [Bdellovibrionota bacterium]
MAYVVGGSVRDFLLGRESKDHDIATGARPDELCNLFPEAVTVGKQFGVIKVPIQEEGGPPEMIEIATFREDLDYQDYRHPKSVRFSGPVEDARRRDFTINALFYDFKTSRIFDPTGGMQDLRKKIIRAIGNPVDRFKEDALRLLRAVRFAGAIDFKIEQSTFEAIKFKARLIKHVSSERIRDELTLIWTGPKPAMVLELMSEVGLLSYVLPELEATKGVEQSPVHHPEGGVWEHTIKIMQCLVEQNQARSPALSWATLLHDVGKPAAYLRSNKQNFNGHEADGAKIAHDIVVRLRMPGAECEKIVAMISDHLKFKDAFQMRESTLQRFIRQPYFEDLLALHKADALSSDGNLAHFEFCKSMFDQLKKLPHIQPPKHISGDDLIQLGFTPGPQFAKILREIEDLALEGQITSKEQALEYVMKMFVK